MTEQLIKPIPKPITLPWKPTPIVGIIGDNKLYNWHGYKIITGHGKGTAILDDIEHRRRTVKQNMIVVVGAPGEGKSYFALRLAQIFDPKFNPYQQVVFERAHLLNLLGPTSPLKMGQVIIIDEAQFIAGARRWYEDIQKDVMEHIEAIRSRGFVILIVALHLELLDKIIRNYVLSHMMLMKERGKATVYYLFTPPFQNKLFRKTMGKMSLQIPSYEQCKYPSCLICKYIGKCMTIRAIYERMKTDFLGKMSLHSQAKAAERDRKSRIIDYDDTIHKISVHRDKVTFFRNRVEPESIKMILEDQYGLILSDIETSRLIKRGTFKLPDVFKQKKEEK